MSLFLFIFLLISCKFVNSRPPFACDPEDSTTQTLAFCQTSLAIPQRVNDLIQRLTLQEKIMMLGDNAAAVPRLGIKGYEWWSEALHGVSDFGPGTKFGGEFPGATSFPQVIGTAASFNVTLWEEIGRVVSHEARAMYNGGNGGLTYWSPNVNIFRDPRWGRGQETPGEDPFLASKYAASYVKGLQGNDGTDRLKVAACCKHFTAYDLDNWNGVDRFHFNAMVSKQDIKDTFEIPFEACVNEGKVASVMCSYNQVNGVPTCADPQLRKTIRDSWHLNGYIVSDCDSVEIFYDKQHYTSTSEEAAADAIKAGLDLDCGSFLSTHAENAIEQGMINETDIDGALANTVAVQMRLGMFDGEPSEQLYGNLGPSDVCTPSHQELALEAARQGIVLLKNDGDLLPLSSGNLRTVAVIGPNSDVTDTMIGNYAGIPCGYVTPLQGIRRYTYAIHQQGCYDVACGNDTLFSGAIDAARQADVTILVMGLDQSIEAEYKDRAGLLLPGLQQGLIYQVAMASSTPVILVLMSGGPVDLMFAKKNPNIGAIIWAGYPGQAGGAAIADVLFGAHNPGGRLPMTWYPQQYLFNLPMTTMDMRSNTSNGYPGRTYRFYNGPVVYPFGHGLSYTNFNLTIFDAPTVVKVSINDQYQYNTTTSINAVRVSDTKCSNFSVILLVDVENTGSRDGSHTVLVFSSPPVGYGAPLKQLVAFKKVFVPAKSQQRVRIHIHVCKYLSVIDEDGVRLLPLGDHILRIGNAKHTISLLGVIQS